MTDPSSAELLDRYRNQNPSAAEELFHRYADRLVAFARSRLSHALSARVDPEDVVQSAYRSFFLLARDGDLVLREPGDLWRLLVRITLRKVFRTVRRHRAECRSIDQEQAWSAEIEAGIGSREPTPAETVALVDELRGLLAPLNPLQRRVIQLRLQGEEVEAIAQAVDRSPRTVRRTLAALGAEMERRLFEFSHFSDEGLLSFSDVILQRQIGQGGMAKVYQARWKGKDELVAVKLLRRKLRDSGSTADRFREEAALLGKLRHPGIVAVQGVGLLPDGGIFLVMELVNGSDLSRQPRTAASTVLRWVFEAAEAIHYANSLGVIHCDLKPSNLLLDRDGRVRVSDFGLARSLADSSGPQGGTTGFMAPEQLDPQGIVSARTDVFGLGAVLQVLLKERTPEIDAVIGRCLAPDPTDRFSSAAELAAHLRLLART